MKIKTKQSTILACLKVSVDVEVQKLLYYFFPWGNWITCIHNFLDTSIITFMKKSMIPANLLYINTKKTLKWLHPIKFIRGMARWSKITSCHLWDNSCIFFWLLHCEESQVLKSQKQGRLEGITHVHPVKAQNFLNFWYDNSHCLKSWHAKISKL